MDNLKALKQLFFANSSSELRKTFFKKYPEHEGMKNTAAWKDFETFSIDRAYRELDKEGFKGYYGIDENGNKFHTFDFEESIGE